MAKVERGNVVLTVSDSLVDSYIAKGYNLVADDGTILKEAIPTDLGALKAAYVAHKKEIATLKEKIQKLKGQSTNKPVTDDEDKSRRRSTKKTLEE